MGKLVCFMLCIWELVCVSLGRVCLVVSVCVSEDLYVGVSMCLWGILVSIEDGVCPFGGLYVGVNMCLSGDCVCGSWYVVTGSVSGGACGS